MIRSVTTAMLALAMMIPAAQADILISPPPSEARLRLVCEMVEGDFIERAAQFGCVNDNCLADGQPCEVLCTVAGRCVGKTDDSIDRPTLVRILTGGKTPKDPEPEPELAIPDAGGGRGQVLH